MFSTQSINARSWLAVTFGAYATAFLLFFLAPVPAKAQRPTAPVGYLVAYVRSDGKKFDDGKGYRIVGVTRTVKERDAWLKEIDSVHRYRSKVIELKNEVEYRAAVKLAAEQKADPKRPISPTPQTMAGTMWRMNAEDNIWFYADGTMEIGSSRRLVSNDKGTWTQEGNKVTLKSRFIGNEVWTVNGAVMNYGLRKATLVR